MTFHHTHSRFLSTLMPEQPPHPQSRAMTRRRGRRRSRRRTSLVPGTRFAPHHSSRWARRQQYPRTRRLRASRHLLRTVIPGLSRTILVMGLPAQASRRRQCSLRIPGTADARSALIVVDLPPPFLQSFHFAFHFLFSIPAPQSFRFTPPQPTLTSHQFTRGSRYIFCVIISCECLQCVELVCHPTDSLISKIWVMRPIDN